MRHVLVIEDQYLAAKCFADMARYAGASSVEIASDETAAVEAAQRQRPSIIISDVDLKEGGRGPNAVVRIQALYGTVPVIFITGNPDDPQACALGAAVLAKPVTAQCLASIFRTIAGDMPRWHEHLEAHWATSAEPCRI